MTTPKKPTTPPPTTPPPGGTHEEVSGRLVDLVYGEGTPAERAALEAHVATCARCRAELAALGETRAQLRVALDDVPVPARAHARILEAARAAIEPQAMASAPALARSAPSAPAAPRVEPPRPMPSRPSFWERMRGKWTLPTLATAGAVAILVIGSKVLLDPRRAQQEVSRLQERARQENAPASPEPVPAASARGLAAEGEPQGEFKGEPAEKAPAAGSFDPLHGKSTLSPEAQAAIDRARGTLGPHRDGILGQFGTPHLGPRYGALASRAIANARQLGAGSGGAAVAPGGAGAGGDESARGAPAKSAPFARLTDEEARGDEVAPLAPAAAGFATPPGGWKGGGRRKEEEAKEAAEAEADKSAAASAALAAPVAVAKKKAAAAEAARAKRDTDDDLQQAEGAAAPAPMADLAAQPAAPPATQPAPKDEAPAAPPYAAPARRAAALYAARRWPEAVAAYRDLLRRWPDAEPAKRWRARLAEARGEAAGTSPAATTK